MKIDHGRTHYEITDWINVAQDGRLKGVMKFQFHNIRELLNKFKLLKGDCIMRPFVEFLTGLKF
jgi:hypothetical protein